MKKLNGFSRVLLALASLSLIATFFVPVWRIDLFAPQYPEGLVMKIWLTHLTGDVDVINGLNHYIGMKKISAEMFPEFGYLIYIVGVYIVFGLTIAVTGNRKLLFSYLLLSVIGAIVALYDFYKWGYEYGHNLNPEAPIKVPGLSYQPPIIGHKKLLNFDAYSMPDVGGWVVIIAISIAFVLFVWDWYKRKKKRKSAPVVASLFFSLLLTSCSTKPEPIVYGKDNCYTCKMGMIDKKFGGEVITHKGKIYKFDDLICMVQFLKSGMITENEIAENVVINYEIENQFIKVQDAFFIVSESLHTPMNCAVAAFENKVAADKANATINGKIILWQELYQKLQ